MNKLAFGVFSLCLFSLIVTLVSFYNLGIYVDEAGTTPSVVLGGDIWLSATWAQMATLALATAISGYLSFKK